MVGGSSMLGLSAVAVEREIVGSDREAELMRGAEAGGCELALAVWRGVVASALGFGEAEKNCTKRLGLTEDD